MTDRNHILFHTIISAKKKRLREKAFSTYVANSVLRFSKSLKSGRALFPQGDSMFGFTSYLWESSHSSLA